MQKRLVVFDSQVALNEVFILKAIWYYGVGFFRKNFSSGCVHQITKAGGNINMWMDTSVHWIPRTAISSTDTNETEKPS